MKNNLRLLSGRKLQSPKSILTRPTASLVREALVNLLSEDIKGSSWLDLCSGSGVIACEALEKGARRVLAVEKNIKISKTCKSNIDLTSKGLEQENHWTVICKDVEKFLREGCKKYNYSLSESNYQFDFIYIDPPYNSNLYLSVLEKLVIGGWTKESSLIICEHSKRLPFPAPKGWIERDRRLYGSSGLIFLSPPKNSHDDTDSKLQQTSLKE